MNDSNSPSNPSPPRATLKLKVAPRRPAEPAKTQSSPQPEPSQPQPHKKAKLKPGAHWSDEYKQRMQADMDALIPR